MSKPTRDDVFEPSIEDLEVADNTAMLRVRELAEDLQTWREVRKETSSKLVSARLKAEDKVRNENR